MYSIHNEGKSVTAQVLAKPLKGRIYKRMTANNSKSYLNYLNKLLDEYDNTYYRSVVKNLLMLIISIWLRKLNQFMKLLNLELGIESGYLYIRITLVKVTLKIDPEKCLLLILCWKIIFGRTKLKI